MLIFPPRHPLGLARQILRGRSSRHPTVLPLPLALSPSRARPPALLLFPSHAQAALASTPSCVALPPPLLPCRCSRPRRSSVAGTMDNLTEAQSSSSARRHGVAPLPNRCRWLLPAESYHTPRDGEVIYCSMLTIALNINEKRSGFPSNFIWQL